MVQYVFLLIVLVATLLGGGQNAGAETTACSVPPQEPSLELVYRLEAGQEGLTSSSGGEAAGIVCERLRALGIRAAEVRAQGDDRIEVVLPPLRNRERIIDLIGAGGRLYFYDWEGNLIGRERLIGGFPGRVPSVRALHRARREWRAAGRNPDRLKNLQLIFSGAFPSVYGAVKLASEQKPRDRCPACSASTSRFYMFTRSRPHELIAGPVAERGDLRGSRSGRRVRAGLVLEVPVGTAIVSEQPSNRFGVPIATAAPGWYALRDRPALSGAEITEPEQETDFRGAPNVTFGFTPAGRTAFREVTRTLAFRGRAGVMGPISSRRAAELSYHLAFVLDDRVMTRPIVDFAENPDGIDAKAGAQISGGFANAQEARDLATILRIGALPVEMTRIGSERTR